MRLSLLFFPLLAFQISAKAISPLGANGVSKDLGQGDFNREDIPSSYLPPQSHHQKRTTRSMCSSPVHNVVKRRDISLNIEYNNVTLDKRVMTVPAGSTQADMNKFMVKEINTATARFYEFRDNIRFGLATGGLCGCTTLVIISRKGVYMGHYWENISFDPEGECLEPFGTADIAFQKTVIEGLTSGVGDQQDALQRKSIEDRYIRAYLMIPDEDHNSIPDGYRDKWNRIKATVKTIIPTLANDALWEDIKYHALDSGIPADQNTLDTTAKGKILFKYEPKENGKKRASLWVEDNATPYHNDIW